MFLALGADENTSLVSAIHQELIRMGHNVVYYGPPSEGGSASEEFLWPKVALKVAKDIAEGRVEEGILCCWTGTGVSMAANKVRGVRAALCHDAETARGARLWNNANVLCLSLRLTSEPVAKEILKTWFGTAYLPNPTDDTCLRIIEELEQQDLQGED